MLATSTAADLAAQPPSILFVSLMNGSAWGGSEELWYRTALHAAGAGWRVGCVVFAWPEKRDRLEALRQAGCEVFELPNAGRARRPVREKLGYELFTRAQQRLAIRRLPIEAYDTVVFNQGGFGEISAGLWNQVRRRARRYALTFHNYQEQLELSEHRASSLRAWLAGASANLFASARIREVLEQRLGSEVLNAALLINPVTFAVPTTVTPLPEAPPFRLAMLAALDLGRKAQENLVAALADPRWTARSWELYLYGEGPDRAQLAAQIEAQGLSGRIRLMGHSPDPRSALADSHLLLQITRADAMPLSVLEAMSMARPVVVSRVGDMPAWVKDDESGFVCEDASPRSISAGLERAWAARERWAEMGERAYRTFRSRYPQRVEQAFLEQLGGAATFA